MNVAFIPVRGGSKSIPYKNIKEIAGKPLVYWTVKAASDCSAIDVVYVATDDDKIRDCVAGFDMPKVEVIGRSKESATDTASTESAMLEFAEARQFDNIVLIQATSPLLSSEDLDGGFALFNRDDVDSVLSVVEQKRFIWKDVEGINATPVNYDVFKRPRRQEFDGYLVENGAFYISARKALLETKNRISGRMAAYRMSPYTYFEIDEPSDWIIIEQQLLKREGSGQVEKKDFSKIKVFLTDCDGCLTDGGMYYSENGDELKKFNTKDGMAFRLLRERGIITGIITGEDRELNRRRAEKLKLDEIISGSSNKLDDIEKICKKYGVEKDEVLYVGDDINDREAMTKIGISCAPADADEKVKAIADIVTRKKGGEGVIREIVDMMFSAD